MCPRALERIIESAEAIGGNILRYGLSEGRAENAGEGC